MTDYKESKVLEGIKVLDFTIALSGVLVAWQFADMGADVWKVEKYKYGDQSRDWVPFVNDLGLMYAYFNKNKRSIEMDLANPNAKEIIYEMVKHADVVLENFKCGSLEKLGFGYEKLKAINPGIVYLSISGFGTAGPLMKLPCYDAVAEARSGLVSVSGEFGGAPMQVGNSVCDALSGIYSFNAVMMALIHAKKTGEGCRVDMAMTDIAMNSCAEAIMDFSVDNNERTKYGNGDKVYAPYGIFEARDGWVSIIVDTPKRWEAFCDAMELAELKTDPDFVNNESRLKNVDSLTEKITEVTKTKFRDETEKLLLDVDVPASSVLTFIEAYTSKHANTEGLSTYIQQEKIGAMRIYENPLHFNGVKCEIRSGSPLLGQHTREILREIGYSDEKIDAFYETGAVASTMI